MRAAKAPRGDETHYDGAVGNFDDLKENGDLKFVNRIKSKIPFDTGQRRVWIWVYKL